MAKMRPQKQVVALLFLLLSGLLLFSAVLPQSAFACPGCGGGMGNMAPVVTGVSAPAEMEIGKPYPVSLTYHDDDGDAVSAIITQGGFAISALAVPDGTDGSVATSFTCTEAGQSMLFGGSVTDAMNNTGSSSGAVRATCISGSSGDLPSPPEPSPPSGGTDESTGKIISSSGDFQLNRRAGHIGQKLYPSDLVEVYEGQWVLIKFNNLTAVKIFGSPTVGGSFRMPKAASGVIGRSIELIRGLFTLDDTEKDPAEMNKWELETINETVSVEGTIFSVDSNSQRDVISITSGKIMITPNNTSSRSFTLEAGNQVTVSSNNVSPVTPIGGAPTPSTGGSSLKSFDKNKNNVLDNDEFFAVVDAWIAGQIDNAMFFKAVDLWISQGQITAAASVKEPVRLSITKTNLPTKHFMTFQAQGEPVTDLDVAIFDLQGHQIFAQDVAGSRLNWNMLSENGRPVANGIYLCEIIARGNHENLLMSKVEKILISR